MRNRKYDRINWIIKENRSLIEVEEALKNIIIFKSIKNKKMISF